MATEDVEAEEFVTPGEVLGKSTDVNPGSGVHSDPHNNLVYASLTGRVRTVRPFADSPNQVTKVMARTASADIMRVGPKSVKEKFTSIIRAYYLSNVKNELGVFSAERTAGETMIPISCTEMQCPLTGQVEKRKVAKVGR